MRTRRGIVVAGLAVLVTLVVVLVPLAPAWASPSRRGQQSAQSSTLSPVAVAAEQVGMSRVALNWELQQGKTIATVAAEHGVAWQDIYATLLARKTAQVEAVVASGQLSRAEADAHLAALAVYQMTPLLTLRDPQQSQDRRQDHRAELPAVLGANVHTRQQPTSQHGATRAGLGRIWQRLPTWW